MCLMYAACAPFSQSNSPHLAQPTPGDASIGALSWWLVGYSFAEGKAGYGNAFIGSGAFAFSPKTGNNVQESFLYAVWLFGWSFAATATTIVSGAVAERIYIG